MKIIAKIMTAPRQPIVPKNNFIDSPRADLFLLLEAINPPMIIHTIKSVSIFLLLLCLFGN